MPYGYVAHCGACAHTNVRAHIARAHAPQGLQASVGATGGAAVAVAAVVALAALAAVKGLQRWRASYFYLVRVHAYVRARACVCVCARAACGLGSERSKARASRACGLWLRFCLYVPHAGLRPRCPLRDARGGVERLELGCTG